MKAVTSTEANRGFSQLLREVTQGETVQITSRGRAVALLSPVDLRAQLRRQAAKASLLQRLVAQPVAGLRDWARDELYD